VAARLEPTAAARVLEQAARMLWQALAKETDAVARMSLAGGLARVAGRLEPAEATRVLRSAARVLEQSFEQATRPSDRGHLTIALADVAPGLEPPEAARVLRGAAQMLARALENEKEAAGRAELTLGLRAVAARLEPAEAARVLREVLEQGKAAVGAFALVADLIHVAARLEPTEARQVLGQAAGALAHALVKEKDAPGTSGLAIDIALLAAHLEPTEAAKMCVPVIQHQLRASAATAGQDRTDTRTMVRLVQALEPQLAADYSKKAVFNLCWCCDPNDSQPVPSFASWLEPMFDHTESLDGLLTNATRPERNSRAAALATALGLAGGRPFFGFPALPTASKPLPCLLSTQDLVELLKMPTCYGEARKVVLRHLGNRYGRTFANHWEFVRYAQEHHLGLDFTTPPKRPERP
jgi:hypothetical protein